MTNMVQQGDVYYYQPLTWKMQWEVPYKTLLCSSCGVMFACAHLTNHMKVYCESCLQSAVESLLQVMKVTEITYRSVKGGFEGSAETNFSKLKSEYWPVHYLQNELAEGVEGV